MLDRWYFVEASWQPTLRGRGTLDLWVDLEPVAMDSTPEQRIPEEGAANLLIGRANADGGANSYARMLIDELLLVYGDRATLERVGVIARGEST